MEGHSSDDDGLGIFLSLSLYAGAAAGSIRLPPVDAAVLRAVPRRMMDLFL